MAQTIKIKRSGTSGNKLTGSNSVAGEIGMNTADKALYIQTGSNNSDVVTVAHESTLKINETNGRVGIGTTSPGTELEIAGPNPILRIRENDQTNKFGDFLVNSGRIRIKSRNASNNGVIAFEGNNGSTTTEYARFNPDGYLGIGETDPSAPLHIGGDGRVAIFGDASFDDKYIELREGGTTGFRMGLRTNLVDTSGCILLQTGDDKGFGIAVNTTADWGSVATSSIPFYVAEGGSVGIGTTSPTYHLHVDAGNNNSTALFEADGVANVVVSGGNNRGSFVVQHSGTTSGALIAKSGGGLEFGVGANYATNVGMTLTSDGDFGIGEASPDRRLHVKDSTLVVSKFESSNTGGVLLDLENAAVPADDAGAYAGIRFYNSSGFDMALSHITESTGNGYVQIGQGWDGTSTILKAHSSGAVTFNDAFTFPTSIGSAGQVLKVPTSGTTLYWADESTASSGTSLSDADGDTKIQVEESSDEDKIRFDTAGTERVVIDSTGLAITAAGVNGLILNEDTSNTQNSARLFFKGSGGTVGLLNVANELSFRTGMTVSSTSGTERFNIHTNAVTAQVQFRSVDGSAATPGISFATDTNTGIFRAGSDLIGIATNATERVRIDNTGRVGIGTTSPSQMLHVNGGAARLTGASADDSLVLQLGQMETSGNPMWSIYSDDVGTDKLEFSTTRWGASYYWTRGSAAGARVNMMQLNRLSSSDKHWAELSLWTQADASATGSTTTTKDIAFNAGSSSYINGGNLGIGTTSPNRQLHIYGSGATVAAKIEATDGNQASVDIKNSEGEFRIISDSGELSIYDQTDTTERLRIDTAGFVGIGTTNPLYQLDVHTTAGTALNVEDDDGWATIRVKGGGDTDNVLELANFGSAASGSLIRTTGTGHLRLFSGNTEAIRIDGTTQNVGVGETTPSAVLHVTTDTDADGIIIQRNSTTGGTSAQLGFMPSTNSSGTPNLWIKGIRGAASYNDNYMTFGTNSLERMRINAAGNIGIGTTSPSVPLHVNGFARFSDIQLTGTDPQVAAINNTSLVFKTNNTEVARFDASGNLGIGTTAPQAVLDLGNGTNGRGIAWGGSSGTAHYNTIWSEYSSASIIIGAGLKGATDSSTFLNPFTGTYGYAAIELDSFSDDGIKFYTGADASRTKDAAITPTEQMRLDNSGRLGIGTSSPAYQLDVSGTGRFTGAVTLDSTLSFSFNTATTALDLNNNNIIDVNNISFSDPGANEGLQWNNVRIFESPDDLTNAAGNLQVTYGGTRRLTVNNTGIDVNGTITGATNISKKAATTATGGTGTEDGTNTWAKLATYSTTQNYSDASFVYSVVTEEQGSTSAGIITVQVRWYDISGSTNPELKISWVGLNSGATLDYQSFKLINDGVAEDVELWVQKKSTYSEVELWETAYNKEGAVTVTYETSSAWQSSTPAGTAVNVTSGPLTFDGKEVIVGDNFTNVTDVTIDGRVTADTLTLKEYGGDTITLTPDPAFSNAPSHGIVYTAYQTSLGDYITLKAAGNSTSGHGVIGVADNGVYFGKTDVETGSHQMSDSATAPLDTTYGFINGSGLNTSKLAINTLTPHSGTRAQICAGSTNFSMNSTAISNTTLVLSNSDDDYGTVFATAGTGKGYIQQRRTATATYYDLSLQPYGGNLGIGTDAPIQYVNTGSYFKPDTNGKFLTINGDGNGSFIMLESTSNTNGDQIGGLYFTDGTGQSDAHRQVAGIDAIVVEHATNDNLDGADLRFFTKPAGGGVTDPRMTIKGGGFVGINTNNPAYRLDLSSGTTNIAARFFSTDATTNIMLQDNSATTYFSTSDGNAYFGGSAGLSANNLTLVQSSGNVGIGDYTPNYKLHVNSGTTNVVATFESTDNEAWINLKDDVSGNYGCLIGFDSDNSNLFKIADSSVNTKFTLKGTGRVGIGIDDPTEMLEVYTNGSRAAVRIHEDAGTDVARLHLRTGGNDTHIQNDPSNGFEIRTENNLVNADPALRIQGGGNATFGYDVKIKELGIDTTETSTSATTEVAIDSFAAATFRSARYTIQVTNSTDSTYHITEILLIHDGSTPQITEYGTIFTGSAEATFDADISSGNVRLLATPATTDSMTFKVVRHCITV